MSELENSEFAKALEEAVGKFFEFDSACDKVTEKGILVDVVGPHIEKCFVVKLCLASSSQEVPDYKLWSHRGAKVHNLLLTIR